jgi:hypothetical protein
MMTKLFQVDDFIGGLSDILCDRGCEECEGNVGIERIALHGTTLLESTCEGCGHITEHNAITDDEAAVRY